MPLDLQFNVANSIPIPSAASAITRRINYIPISQGQDSLSVTQQPTVGRAIPNARGGVTLDLRNVELADIPGNQLSMTLQLITGGTPSLYNLSVNCILNQQAGGLGPATWFVPETDSNDDVVLRMGGPNFIAIYVAAAGLTTQQIQDRETNKGNPLPTGSWLIANAAQVGGDLPDADGVRRYGATPGLALHPNRARQMWLEWTKAFAPCAAFVLYKAGDDFSSLDNVMTASGAVTRGYSPNYPIVATSYGAGAKPVGAQLTNGHNTIIHNVKLGGQKSLSARWHMIAHTSSEHELNFEGISGLPAEFCSSIRHHAHTVYKRNPNTRESGTKWSEKNNRISAHYFANHLNGFVWGSTYEEVGWQRYYDINALITNPQPPTIYSHCIYFSGYGNGLGVKDCFFSHGSLTGVQQRPGGFSWGNVFIGSNVLNLMGAGPDAADLGSGEPIAANAGDFTYFWDNVGTWGGAKTTYAPYQNLISARGFQFNANQAVARKNVVCHSGTGNSAGEEEGGQTVYPAFGDVGGGGAINIGGSVLYNDTIVYKWSSDPNANLGTLNTATLDVTTLQDWGVANIGAGTSRHEAAIAFKTFANPYAQHRSLHAFFQAGFETGPAARASAQTLVFQPDNECPGHMWDDRFAWSTGDTPGTVAGDSVNLWSHETVDCFSRDLANISELYKHTQFGGRLNISGNVTPAGATGDLIVDGAGQIHFTASNVAGVQFTGREGGRVRFSGAITQSGATNYTFTDRSELLLGVNTTTITLRGITTLEGSRVRCGWDGDLGQTATTTLHADHKLRMKAGLTINYDGADFGNGNHFAQYQTVTGSVTGHTAKVVWNHYIENTRGQIFVEDATGPFQDNEGLVGIGRRKRTLQPSGQIALVNGATVPGLPTIKILQTNLFNGAAPNVTANIVLGGLLEVDLTAYAATAQITNHPLIVASSVTGSFAATPSVIGLGVSRNAIFTITSTHVYLSVVTGGDGTISVV